MLILALFFTLASTTAGFAQGVLSAEQLDKLLLDTCGSSSAIEICKTRISEVRKGLDKNSLLSSAPKLDIDSKIETILISSPTKMIAEYYCLALFVGAIPSRGLEPDIFGFAVRGFSFSKDSEKDYSKWLASPASENCRPLLSEIGLEPAEVTIQKPYQIVLNPITFLEAGAEEGFTATAVTTYNHERLHALYADEKAQNKVLNLWAQLSKGQQDQFQREHPSYDFKNIEILAREFFSYTFERHPEKAVEFLKAKNKRDYTNFQKETCAFCVRHDPKTLTLAQQLVLLEPKALVEYIERDGVKVLILPTKRRSPSPLFNWSSVRIDEGQLTQITKLEGALGKTLCAGEKPESKDGITVVVAADSPYSTLVHEYLHVLQIRRDPSWCPLSKQLWGKKEISAFEQRMVRDREWDVRVVLWDVLATVHMNVEDKLTVASGLVSEGELRGSYDSSAAVFLKKNKIAEARSKAIRDYMKVLKSGKN